jgi:predicted Zn-dependent peptidase
VEFCNWRAQTQNTRNYLRNLAFKGSSSTRQRQGLLYAEVSFRAGEFLLEKEKWETAHLMEHVLLGANRDISRKHAIFKQLSRQNGAYSNASTSVYDITYEIESAHFEWQRVVGLYA